jgi:hypothetical protein
MANGWEITSSNPLGLIKLSSQSTEGVRPCCAVHQPLQTVKNPGPKLLYWAQPAYFHLSHLILICTVTCFLILWSASSSYPVPGAMAKFSLRIHYTPNTHSIRLEIIIISVMHHDIGIWCSSSSSWVIWFCCNCI